MCFSEVLDVGQLVLLDDVEYVVGVTKLVALDAVDILKLYNFRFIISLRVPEYLVSYSPLSNIWLDHVDHFSGLAVRYAEAAQENLVVLLAVFADMVQLVEKLLKCP